MRNPTVLRALFITCAVVLILSPCLPVSLYAQITPRVGDALIPLPAGSIKVGGRMGEKIDLCIDRRIIPQDLSELIDPFRNRRETTTWQCEFWGKWYTSLALAARYKESSELIGLMEKAVGELIETQTSDGYIGTYTDTTHLGTWDVWGRKYTLLGLLAYFEMTQDKKALNAACRHADHLMSEVGPGKKDIEKTGMWHGMASGSILEPMVLLYRFTGDKRYLDFSEYIVARFQAPGGPDLVRKALKNVPVGDMFSGPGRDKQLDYGKYFELGTSKAYEMMSCYEGLCELYRVTGNRDYFTAAEKVFQNILENEITVVGSGSDWERWIFGRFRQTQPVRYWVSFYETNSGSAYRLRPFCGKSYQWLE